MMKINTVERVRSDIAMGSKALGCLRKVSVFISGPLWVGCSLTDRA
jgi:hypothetical protein